MLKKFKKASSSAEEVVMLQKLFWGEDPETEIKGLTLEDSSFGFMFEYKGRIFKIIE